MGLKLKSSQAEIAIQHPTGAEEHHSHKLPPVLVSDPVGEIDVRLGLTIGIAKFQFLRIDVGRKTLHSPGQEDAAYMQTLMWVDDKLSSLRDELMKAYGVTPEAAQPVEPNHG